MKTKKIYDSELFDLTVASLPTRPNAPSAAGGAGLCADEVKAAFDRLPLYLNSRINDLVDDIGATGEDSLAGAIPTGIEEGHTLARLFTDLTDGSLAARLIVGGESLAFTIAKIKAALTRLGVTLEEAENG